ncbi:hypothetical protein [Escherichia coli]
MVKKIFFDTLRDLYKKTATNHPWLSVTSGYHHCSSST